MEKTREGGYYKLTGDFEEVPYSGKYVRDINFTPANRNLPDKGICRIYSSRDIIRPFVERAPICRH